MTPLLCFGSSRLELGRNVTFAILPGRSPGGIDTLAVGFLHALSWCRRSPLSHFLIRHSFRFSKLKQPEVDGWNYDRQQDRWCPTSMENGTKPKPLVSKKADQETGEDMKGP